MSKYDYGINIGIWKNNKLIHQSIFGYADIENKMPMEWNIHMRIGSISKMFTIAIILKLCSKKLIALDDKVSKYIDNIDDNITIKNLGNMTSGLYNYTEDEQFNKKLDDDPQKSWTINELLEISLKNEMLFKPGTKCNYSNTNIILLGIIAEKITGKKLEDLYEEYIFKPLNLLNTYIPIDNTIKFPYANGYMIGKNYDNEDKNLYNVTHINTSWVWSVGQIISTIEDLNIFIKYFVDNLLMEQTIVQTECEFIEYGFGFIRINKKWYGHNGQIPGFQTIALYSPEDDISIIVCTNIYTDENNDKPADKLAIEIINNINKYISK